MSLLELFCEIDDFCAEFLPSFAKEQLASGFRQRRRTSRLCASEIMTILVLFHQSGYRNFKTFYLLHVHVYLHKEFPGLLSYSRFIELVPFVLVPLGAYLCSCRGACSGISYVDSTPLKVCHNARIHCHKVFAGFARRGKSTTGWFFGFKLHLVINERGELLALSLTPANVDDRTPLPQMAQTLFGKLFGDKGYLSKALRELLSQTLGLHLITRPKKNAKDKQPLLPYEDSLLLKKRGLVDSVIHQLKNKSQIEHTRHRSTTGFLANLFAGLLAYTKQNNKPSICIQN